MSGHKYCYIQLLTLQGSTTGMWPTVVCNNPTQYLVPR